MTVKSQTTETLKMRLIHSRTSTTWPSVRSQRDSMKKAKGFKKSTKKKQQVNALSVSSNDSSDGSSDEDVCAKEASFYATRQVRFPVCQQNFVILSNKGTRFKQFFKPCVLEVSNKTELYEVLYYCRLGIQCARTLCHLNNQRISHAKCKSKFQARSHPVILLDFRSVQQVGFPLTESVTPTEIRNFLQSGSIVSYTRQLAGKAGPINKDSANGYMARDAMTTGLTMVTLMEEFDPYRMIFSNGVESLVR